MSGQRTPRGPNRAAASMGRARATQVVAPRVQSRTRRREDGGTNMRRTSRCSPVGALLVSLRPQQWSMNILVFAALLFSKNLFAAHMAVKSVAGFAAFCALSSAIYLVNDLVDIESDRHHPLKARRPLAAGELSPALASVAAALLGLAGLVASFALNVAFGVVAAVYFLLTCAYSLYLKRVVILHVLLVAAGYVLRAVAGAEVIQVPISPWLILCTMFLALLISLAKRRHELLLLGPAGQTHRDVLVHYSPQLLDQMIGVMTGSAVISYALYTTAEETVAKFGSRGLLFTLAFVLYGVLRYLYLLHGENMGGSPEAVFAKDLGMAVNLLLYALTVAAVIYLK